VTWLIRRSCEQRTIEQGSPLCVDAVRWPELDCSFSDTLLLQCDDGQRKTVASPNNSLEGINMNNVFDWSYFAAQRTAGTEVWERLSDVEKMRAIARQIGFSLLYWPGDGRQDMLLACSVGRVRAEPDSSAISTDADIETRA
jgi:hypothetical protein